MWNAPPPMVGVAPGMKRAAAEIGLDVFMTVAFTFMGSWLGGKATPKEPTKGNIIGGATGYFASLLVKQNSALARIADHTKDLQR